MRVGRVLFIGVGAFLALELSLRIVQRVRYGTPITALIPTYRAARFRLSPFLTFGPRIDWQVPGKLFPEYAHFNAQGFRTREIVERKKSHEYRIIALGGSTTENVWGKHGIHWPLVAQCALREAGHDSIRVLNTGMSGFTTAHSLIRLAFDVLDYDPDMVLQMEAVNDLGVTYTGATRGKAVDPHYLIRYGERSFTGDVNDDDVVPFRVIRAARNRLARRPVTSAHDTLIYDLEPARRIYQRNLKNMAVLARAHGTRFVLLTQPFDPSRPHGLNAETGEVGVFIPVSPQAAVRDLSAFNDFARSVGEEMGIDVIDMQRRLSSDPSLFVDFVHYSSKGTVAFGEALAGSIARILAGKQSALSDSSLPCTWARRVTAPDSPSSR